MGAGAATIIAGPMRGAIREDVSAHVERDFDLELAALDDLEALTDDLLATLPTKIATRAEADRIIALAVAPGDDHLQGRVGADPRRVRP